MNRRSETHPAEHIGRIGYQLSKLRVRIGSLTNIKAPLTPIGRQRVQILVNSLRDFRESGLEKTFLQRLTDDEQYHRNAQTDSLSIGLNGDSADLPVDHVLSPHNASTDHLPTISEESPRDLHDSPIHSPVVPDPSSTHPHEIFDFLDP